ncbi:NAD(P)/FAD-dependent oxidoreductase [Gordonia sputi]|uniref:Putative ferredoxin reductase n=1 Tax=Gordonia sputi NBRC 100414 TaxID=1089453 RepID=H5U3H0_9ACTN|nr:FAD-dependent oxidoreductase [Gordonia sputi]NKY95930.1 FAD-dependent oxidoreductase [Gordonia sputi]GAB40278.1 putative ferredoxin reductase [Gordonia sputi NBRC 100414]
MSTDRVVIVGGGQAGFEAATRLRANGFDGQVALIGDEATEPYQRPPLSKAYLQEGDHDSLALRPRDHYLSHNIRLECGRSVTAIDRRHQRVELDNGAALDYDHLVLATGARNRPLPVPGADLEGVFYLRTADEASALVAALATCTSLVVIGAGFIGLEVAAAARKRDVAVTVVEALNRPMTRALSAPMSDYFAAEHVCHGVDLRLETGVTQLLGVAGHVSAVRVSDGTTIPADTVLIGIGVLPNTELADSAGLPTHNGIIVDRHLRTPDPRVWAIGDCAAFPAADSDALVRLESVQNAVDHARCVAAQLVGGSDGYHEVPWFWSEQYDSKLQMAGRMSTADTHVLRGSIPRKSFSVFGFRSDRLVGVESVNAVRDHMAARKALACGMPVTPTQIADAAFDLKASIKEFQTSAEPVLNPSGYVDASARN